MNKVIWKYELPIIGDSQVFLPIGAEILSIQTQENKTMIWALVGPNTKDKEERYFEMFGTGHPIYCDMGIDRRFISTIQLMDGQFVYHVFERIN